MIARDRTSVLLDGVRTSYPFPVWGARVAYRPTPGFEAKVGAYQLTRNMFVPDKHGMDLVFRDSDGIPVFTGLAAEPGWHAGSFAVGVNSVSFHMPEFTLDETTHAFFHYTCRRINRCTRNHPARSRVWCCS